MNKCADFFAVQDAGNILRIRQGKNDDRNVIIHRHGSGCAVHDLKAHLQHFAVSDFIIANSFRIIARISAVDAVNILGKKNGITAGLKGTEYGSCIG